MYIYIYICIYIYIYIIVRPLMASDGLLAEVRLVRFPCIILGLLHNN